ncbi:MAG TPA: hypothetical protein VIF62_27665 [Labilithrix sp.]
MVEDAHANRLARVPILWQRPSGAALGHATLERERRREALGELVDAAVGAPLRGAPLDEGGTELRNRSRLATGAPVHEIVRPAKGRLSVGKLDLDQTARIAHSTHRAGLGRSTLLPHHAPKIAER